MNLLRRLIGLVSQRRLRDLNEEMEQHLEFLAEEFRSRGMSEEEARLEARRHFGNLGRTQEQARETATLPSLDSLAQDARFAVRRLRNQPLFTLTAVLSIALGIGASTAVFSVVNGVLLRPLPFPEPDRLLVVREVLPQMAHLYPSLPANASHFLEWQRQSGRFAHLAALTASTLTLTGKGSPERLPVSRISPEFLPMLGVQPAMGRNFLPEEDQPGRDRVLLVSHGFWMRRLGGDPQVLQTKLLLDGAPYTIIGVLPASFHPFRGEQLGALVELGASTELYKPLALDQRERSSSGDHDYAVIGRLKPGATQAQAAAELDAIEKRLTAELPERLAYRAMLTPLQEQVTGGARRMLWLVLAAVCTVLLIVCVNLGSLMLARAVRRQRESAIRTALGASTSRLMQQALLESVWIATAGGVLGVLCCYLAVGTIATLAPAALPRVEEIRVDGAVLGFGVAMAAVTALVFGGAPAWLLSRTDPQDALKAGAQTTTTSRRGLRLREIFVTAEVAFCTALLIVCVLLVSSVVRLAHVDRGMRTDSVIAADFTLPANRYTTRQQTTEALDRVLEKVKTIPGVRSAALISWLPFHGDAHVMSVGKPGVKTPPSELPIANFRFVSPEYFETMGIPLREGRVFDQTDRNRATAVASDRVAQRIWPGENVLGKRFDPGSSLLAQPEIVGVAGATREVRLQQEPGLMIYLPYWAREQWHMGIVVRTQLQTEGVSAMIRPAIWSIDRDIPVESILPLQQIAAESMAPRTYQAAILSLFGGAALLVAMLGIYGLIAYTVAQRTNEFGIRIALGARAGHLYQAVFRQGLRPVVFGLAVGLAGAIAGGRLLESLLFATSALDPLAYGLVTLLLFGIAAGACYFPARRCARIDPNLALRYE